MRRDLIYDVGLHQGEDSAFYLKKGFSVVGIEANPELAAQAAEKFRSYVDSGQLTILNKAIARDEGRVSFFVNDAVTVWGTIDPEWARRNRHLGTEIREINVEGVRFSNLVRDYGIPYYLKIDIEGADTYCLEDLLTTPDRPRFVSIESTKTSFDEVVKEFCLLQRLGYDKYKIIPQHIIEQQKLPLKPLEGKYVHHVFEKGSSGAFGLELPGDWIGLEAALKEYIRIFRKYRLFGDAGVVSDLALLRNTLNARRIGHSSPVRRIAGEVLRVVGKRLHLQPGWYDTHAMYSG
jgi:FkbM family methyltransferase